MNESLFNDASLTNLHVVTSPISTYICPWIRTSLTCAPAQFVVFHLLHTDRMQLYTVSEKYTPWLLTVICCNLSAILLLNPLNTVGLSLRSHQRSSASSSLSDWAAESESWLFLPVIVASLISKNFLRLFLSPYPFPYSSRFLIHVCSMYVAYVCQFK